MGNTAYLFNDYIKDLAGASITLTNEDSNYPTENSQTEEIADATRTTAKVAIKYQFELASAKALQIFYIGNHNFSGGTFDINSYTANDYSTGKTTVESAVAVRSLDVYHRESSAPTARQWWEFDLSSITSADSYFEMGRVMVYDDLVQWTEKQDIERGRGYDFGNVINVTSHGIRWAHKLFEKREKFRLNWTVRPNTNIPTELKTLVDTTNAGAHPFLYVPDLAITDCYYVFVNQDGLNWVERRGESTSTLTSDISLELIEAVRGKA